MRFYCKLVWTAFALATCATATGKERILERRQSEPSNTPASATSDSQIVTTSNVGRPTSGPTLGQENGSSATPTSSSETAVTLSSGGDEAGAPKTTLITSPVPTSKTTSSTNISIITVTPTQTGGLSATMSEASQLSALPIQPSITPAFGIGGVILILTGIAYSLVGVKHRLLQIVLSNGYLAALAATVLIDYVMKPPISDAVQGAYFVAIFLSGALFGAGSLIFKEVTEGFGCLLGGFCLSMWFLCLKPGGLITDQTGKAVLISVFCVTVWSLSFSHYTREYGLIGSTSFAGATAFVLGIDCFSQAGLKEFWFYLWQLNDNLFPLNTNSYPMTRGMIVELIVIVLVTIIGVLSQIKLWRLVRARRERRDAMKLDDERRRDVVEEAIGRALERQNERDRPNWEKQFGNNLTAKRSTILWTDANPDKAITHVVPFEDKRMVSSVESLEMLSAPGTYRPRSKISSTNLKHQSTATVNAIPEEEEEDVVSEKQASKEHSKALSALDANAPADASKSTESVTIAEDPGLERPTTSAPPIDEAPLKAAGPEIVPLPFKIPTVGECKEREARPVKSDKKDSPGRLEIPHQSHDSGSKRRSLASVFGLSQRPSIASDRAITPSASSEQLVLPSPRSSRASSIAATLDEEDRMSISDKYTRHNSLSEPTPAPYIEISQCDSLTMSAGMPPTTRVVTDEAPPSPSAEPIEFEEDPEAFFRPVAHAQGAAEPKPASTASNETPRQGSHSSEARWTTEQSSITDELTSGALERIPKQTSHVVLSYRTNEWAKHIAEADEPVLAGSEQIAEEVGEPSTQLAPVQKVDQSKTLQASTTPPPPHVASADQKGIVAVVPVPVRLETTRSVPILSPSAAALALPAARPSLKGKRSSTFSARNTLAAERIDENTVATFATPIQTSAGETSTVQRLMSPLSGQQRMISGVPLSAVPPTLQPVRSATSLSYTNPYMLNRTNSSSTNVPIAYVQPHQQLNPFIHSSSSLGHSFSPTNSAIIYQNPHLSRSSSFMSGVAMPAMRSETRLESYESHQPTGRSEAAERQRRENLLAEWRSSQAQQMFGGGLVGTIPSSKEGAEARRAQMLMDREQRRLVEERNQFNKAQAQMIMDQNMRRPEMMDAHREMMKRMQAGVKGGS